jgi:hypothetical protein
VQEVEKMLTALLFSRYFALGLLYHYNNQDAAAVQVSPKAFYHYFKISII